MRETCLQNHKSDSYQQLVDRYRWSVKIILDTANFMDEIQTELFVLTKHEESVNGSKYINAYTCICKVRVCKENYVSPRASIVGTIHVGF
jgi:hypothetical protein